MQHIVISIDSGGLRMKKILIFLIAVFQINAAFSGYAQSTEKYTVVSGDSMWKIAVKYEVGLSEIKNANPQIANPELIYPGQILNIPKPDATVVNYENEVIRLVNEIRVKNGLNTLEADWELSRVARYKSQDMKENNYFSHTSPVYGTPFAMIKNFGISYKSAAENIARGQKTPKAVVNSWMNSSGHRANILNASYKKIGVGYVASGSYWTQMFIG
jgi:uncharacterized YkwD family protein/spore coat assembly protein SafA